MPGAAQYHPLVISFFEIGPVLQDGYMTWQELDSWQRVTGTDLDPWEASLVLDMSKAYLQQRHESKSIACICPWPKGQNIWRYALDEKYKRQREQEEKLLAKRKEKEHRPDGTRKRHRNSPPG